MVEIAVEAGVETLLAGVVEVEEIPPVGVVEVEIPPVEVVAVEGIPPVEVVAEVDILRAVFEIVEVVEVETLLVAETGAVEVEETLLVADKPVVGVVVDKTPSQGFRIEHKIYNRQEPERYTWDKS